MYYQQQPHHHHHHLHHHRASATAASMTCLAPSSISVYALASSPKWDLTSADNCLLAIYCFIRNFISASGASTVAIDNKIEQAMDLVKSHLMFAVREEVDVLKEKITELMDRINQLEYENSVLKANATAETLAMLSQPPNPSST